MANPTPFGKKVKNSWDSHVGSWAFGLFVAAAFFAYYLLEESAEYAYRPVDPVTLKEFSDQSNCRRERVVSIVRSTAFLQRNLLMVDRECKSLESAEMIELERKRLLQARALE